MAQVEEHWRIEESEYVDYDQLQFNDEGVVHLKSSHRELSFISKLGIQQYDLSLAQEDWAYNIFSNIHLKKINNDTLLILANCDYPDTCFYGFSKITFDNGIVDFTKKFYQSIHGYNFRIKAVEIDSNSNIWVVFEKNNTGYITIQKLNSNGNLIWENNYPVLSDVSSSIQSFKLDSNNNGYLAITEYKPNSKRSSIFKKITEDGTESWTNGFENMIPDTATYNISLLLQDIHFDDNNDLVFVGNRYSPSGLPIVENNLFVGCVNKNSGLLKHFSFYEIGELDSESVYQSQSMPNNQILLYGKHRNFQENEEIDSIYMALLDTSSVVWQTSQPNSAYHHSTCPDAFFCSNRLMAIDKNYNSYLVTQNESNLVFQKTNLQGETLWTYEVSNSFETDISIHEITLDDYGNIYYLGSKLSSGTTSTYQSILIKLKQDPETGLPTLINDDFSLKTSPNPFNYQLQINSIQLFKTINIYNTMGQVVYSTTTISGSELTITTAQWQSGVYFIVAELENGQTIQTKVMKF